MTEVEQLKDVLSRLARCIYDEVSEPSEDMMDALDEADRLLAE